MATYSHHGLRQQSVREIHACYDIHGPTRITTRACLPAYLTDRYWERHRLSLHDLGVIIQTVLANLVWCGVILQKQDVSASAVKPSLARPCESQTSSKANGINKLISYSHKFNNRHNVLHMEKKSQVCIPPLPIHVIQRELFAQIKYNIVPRLAINARINVVSLFDLIGCRWVARTSVGNMIQMCRVVPKRIYDKSGKNASDTFATRPIVLHYVPENQLYCLTEETMLVTACENRFAAFMDAGDF